MTRDKLQSECNVVEKVSEYYRNQQVSDVDGFGEKLILSRTIGYPCLVGNQHWIARDECYVCQRWQITLFLYKPDLRRLMTRRAGEVQNYYISGSWESLMQGYGEIEWTKFKMIQIKEFMRDFDPSYIPYEEYE